MSDQGLSTLLNQMLADYSFSAARPPRNLRERWQKLVARVREVVNQDYEVRNSNIALAPRVPVIGVSHPQHSAQLNKDLLVAVAIDTADDRVLFQLTQGVESAREAVTETSEQLSTELQADKLLDRLYQLADRYRGYLSEWSTDSLSAPTPRRIYFDDQLTTSTNEYYGPACITHHVYRPGERTNATLVDALGVFIDQLEYLVETVGIDRPKDAQVSYSSLWYDRTPETAAAAELTRVATIAEVEGAAGRVEFYDIGFPDDGPHLRHVGSGSIPRAALPDEPFGTMFAVSDPTSGTIRVQARLGSAEVGITPNEEVSALMQEINDALGHSSASEVDG